MPRQLTRKHYLLAFGALIVLTLINYGISYVNLGWINTVIALSIASTKAMLITLFLMGLVEQKSSNGFVFAFMLIMIFLLVLLTGVDVLTRDNFGIVPPGA